MEVGDGGMEYDEYKTHFSMWVAIKSPWIMGTSWTDWRLKVMPSS